MSRRLIPTFSLPALLGMVLAASLAGCDTGPPRPRHVVVLLADTLRWDYVSAYHEGLAETPAIDRLADGGIRFEKAFTTSPISAPAYGSLFTSLYPHDLGLTNNGQDLKEESRSLTEILKNEGYDTAAFVANGFCNEVHGFGQGFDEFFGPDTTTLFSRGMSDALLPWLDERDLQNDNLFLFVAYFDPHTPYMPQDTPPWAMPEFNGNQLAPFNPENLSPHRLDLTLPPGRSRLILHRDPAHPPHQPHWVPAFYLYRNVAPEFETAGIEVSYTGGAERAEPRPGVQMWRVTFPLELELNNPKGEPVDGWLELRFLRDYTPEEAQALYPLCVEEMDLEIGRVLEVFREAGVFDDTLFVFLSDHGEGLGEHGLVGHIDQLYDSLLRVPLLMRYPPLGAGVYEHPVSLVDVAPTVLATITGAQRWERGESLAEAVRTGQPIRRHGVFGETWPPEALEALTAWRTEGAKVIFHPEDHQTELYNLAQDPGELHNLADADPELLQSLTDPYLRHVGVEDPHTLLTDELLQLDALSPEKREELMATGYLTPGGTD